MKQNFLKVLSVILAALTLVCSAPLAGLAGIDIGSLFTVSAAKISAYSVGDIIEFGWYPQSEVTDSSIISALNSAGGNWISYGYYSGTQYGNLGSLYDGQMKAGDFMRYKDVMYGSDKYRGVVFDIYRPGATGKKIDDYHSSDKRQWSNGYTYGNVYWFKYEPIEWRVLDPDTGMVMAETILDSQAYNNYILRYGTDGYGVEAFWGDSSRTYYANDYANSSIRKWLNDDFYNTAFSTAQQGIIKYTRLDNSASREEDSDFDSAATNDKIYLLSWDDVLNTSYGFSSDYKKYDAARRTQGSDYAKCQGLWVFRSDGHSYDGVSEWLLRSAFNTSNRIRLVCTYGHVNDYTWTYYTDCGIRPALNFNPSSQIIQSDVKDTGSYSGEVPVHKHSYTSKITTPATCTSKGVKTFTCSCGSSYTESIPTTDHVESDWIRDSYSTCTVKGQAHKECTVCGATVRYGEYPLADHNYKLVFQTPATCTLAGSKTYKCSGCSETYSEEIPATDHVKSDWIIDTYPTCTEKGYAHKECTVCGTVTNTGYYNPTGHSAGNWEVSKEATCTATGTKVKKCTKCGIDMETDEIAMTNHKEGNWETTGKATCTQNGERVKKCTYCQKTIKTEVIKATGHSSNNWSVKTPATCTANGEKVGKCTVCGSVTATDVIPATGHKESDWIRDSYSTCTVKGKAHKECTVCGEITLNGEYELLSHTAGNWEITQKATCTEKGTKVKKCTSCKTVMQTEEIAATGHSSNNWTVKTPATCTENGEKVGKCTVCGNVTATDVIPATGHSYAVTSNLAPTCTNAGSKSYKCSSCQHTYSETIPATGHVRGNWETVTAATCTTDGVKKEKCPTCKTYINSQTIPATGHTSGDWEIIKEATCTETGLKKGKCSVCKEYLESVTIPATGHKESDWITDSYPTCTEKGDAHKECTVCGIITIRGNYDPTGHKAGNWETVLEPTKETEGKKVKKCTVCGVTLEEEVIAKIPKEAVKDDTLIKTPSRTSINYCDTIVLHVDASKIPEGGYVEWTKSNDNFDAEYVDETHVSCEIDPSDDGTTVFTATVYDADGNPILTDDVTMRSNASLFRKIIGLFRLFFGLSRSYPEAFGF